VRGLMIWLWFNLAQPGSWLNPLPFPSLPACPRQELLDYSKAEPLGGFLLRRPLTRARCGGGIALSHLRAGCSTVSAGGTAHARGACVLGARVDRRTAAGWAGAPSGCWPERGGEVAQAETPCDTTVWSERRANLPASL
jgi:hypothetical protein